MSIPFAAIPSPSVNAFEIGPLKIHFYALCIIVGIVLALWITAKRLKARGVSTEIVYDIGIWCVLFGIPGGRIYHVLSHWPDYFGEGKDPIKALYVWEGGLAIMGAISLGAVGAWLGCRRSGLKLSAFADAAAPGLLVAQAMGRWGNWFNQELFGGPTTLPWGLRIDPSNPNFPGGVPSDTLFHPMFLYEMIWNLACAALLVALDRKFRFRGGAAMWLYVMLYSAGRYVFEHMRLDPAVILTFFGIEDRINSWAALLIFLLGAIGFVLTQRRSRRLAAAGEREALEDPFSDRELAGSKGFVLDEAEEKPSEKQTEKAGSGSSSAS